MSICELHPESVGHPTGQCSRCDECDHEDASHVEDYSDTRTCWGQSRCSECAADSRPARNPDEPTPSWA